ncbi:hypothetical protein Fot_19788 [Forsythia ovata]|uniref:Uncharacterized protein n=1 Tax=Forsythia ovata TaxID=205694 RepID=A0ABD1VM42_9LAMI
MRRRSGGPECLSLLFVPVFLLTDCLVLPDEGTGLEENEAEGTFDITSSAREMKEGPPTIVSGVCKTVIPGSGVVEDTGGGREISATTPPRLILSFGTLGKLKPDMASNNQDLNMAVGEPRWEG